MLYDGVRDFQEHAKRRYTTRNDALSIVVGGRGFNEDKLRISRGIMTIDPYAAFF